MVVSAVAKIWRYLSGVLVFLLVLLAVLLAGVRLVGLVPYAILSGSMTPTYAVGSLIYVRHVDPHRITEGDVITFVLNKQLQTATHRVIKVDTQKEEFMTKGDANDSADAQPVHFNNYVGKVIFSLPGLGYVSNWVSRPPGLYLGLSLAALFILLMLLPDLFKKSGDPKSASEAQSAHMDKAPEAKKISASK